MGAWVHCFALGVDEGDKGTETVRLWSLVMWVSSEGNGFVSPMGDVDVEISAPFPATIRTMSPLQSSPILLRPTSPFGLHLRSPVNSLTKTVKNSVANISVPFALVHSCTVVETRRKFSESFGQSRDRIWFAGRVLAG